MRMKSHSRSLAILLVACISSGLFGQAVNPGRVNVVTTPWSVNWLTHANDAAALTDLGHSAWSQSRIGDADVAARLTALGFDAWVQSWIGVADANELRPILALHLGVVNVRDDPYLAKGDGVADDTAAFQAALAAIDAAGGGTLYVPKGLYRVTTSQLEWDPAERHHALVIRGDGLESRIYQETADVNLFSIGARADVTPPIRGFELRSICLMTVAGTGTALELNGIARCKIEDVYILGAGRYAIWGHGGIITEVNRLNATVSFSDHKPVGPTIGAPTDAWLRWERVAAYGASGGTNANFITNPCIEGGTCDGIQIVGSGRSWIIAGGTVEGITAPGKAFNIEEVKNLIIDNVYVEASEGVSTLTHVYGGRLSLSGNNPWLFEACRSLDISGLVVLSSAATMTIDSDCRNMRLRGILNTQRHQQVRIENTDTEMDLVIDYADTYIGDAAQYGQGLVTRACPIMVNGMQRWDDPNTPSAPWAIQGTPNLGANTATTWSGAAYSAKVRVADPEAYDGIEYSIPDAFLGQWVSIEVWVWVESGEAGLWVYGPSRQLAMVTHIGGWVRMQGSMKAAGTQRVFRIISGAATVPDTVFYIGGVNIYCESDSTHRADGAGSPSGVVTPAIWGQEYYDATNGKWYKSTGFANTDWVALN